MPVAKPKLDEATQSHPRHDAGRGVHAANPDRAVSLAEAAEMLGMSEKLLGWNLDDGTIPHHMVGKHRRILLRDVLEYKETKQQRYKALDNIAAERQRLGMGYTGR